MDAMIRQDILITERKLFDGLAAGHLDESLVVELAGVASKVAKAVDEGALSDSTILLCEAVSRRIQTVTERMCQARKAAQDAHKAIIDETRQHISHYQVASKSSPHSSSPSPSDAPDYTPYRHFFLSHLSYPYPDPTERHSLLSLVPQHTDSQLSTWFVNARRRSGWTRVFKEEAGEKRERMEEIVRADGEGVRGVRAYLEGGREAVGEKVWEVVREKEKRGGKAKRVTSIAQARHACGKGTLKGRGNATRTRSPSPHHPTSDSPDDTQYSSPSISFDFEFSSPPLFSSEDSTPSAYFDVVVPPAQALVDIGGLNSWMEQGW